MSALFRRDLRLALSAGGGALMGVLFFLVLVTMLPFAIGPELALLRRIGPAMLWLGALLAVCSRSTACSPPITTMARSTSS